MTHPLCSGKQEELTQARITNNIFYHTIYFQTNLLNNFELFYIYISYSVEGVEEEYEKAV